jgi:hypothetical protein
MKAKFITFLILIFFCALSTPLSFAENKCAGNIRSSLAFEFIPEKMIYVEGEPIMFGLRWTNVTDHDVVIKKAITLETNFIIKDLSNHQPEPGYVSYEPYEDPDVDIALKPGESYLAKQQIEVHGFEFKPGKYIVVNILDFPVPGYGAGGSECYAKPVVPAEITVVSKD